MSDAGSALPPVSHVGRFPLGIHFPPFHVLVVINKRQRTCVKEVFTLNGCITDKNVLIYCSY